MTGDGSSSSLSVPSRLGLDGGVTGGTGGVAVVSLGDRRSKTRSSASSTLRSSSRRLLSSSPSFRLGGLNFIDDLRGGGLHGGAGLFPDLPTPAVPACSAFPVRPEDKLRAAVVSGACDLMPLVSIRSSCGLAATGREGIGGRTWIGLRCLK